MDEWIVVSSKSGKKGEHGIPCGNILYRLSEDVQKLIREEEINDPIIESYSDARKRWEKEKIDEEKGKI